MMTKFLPISFVFALALLTTGCGHKQAADSPAPWPKSVLEEVAAVPVLDDGRVKPFDSWAAFTLLRMNGVRSCRDADNNVISPRAWALDALFRPPWARQHRCFLITTSEVLDALKLEIPGRKMRDRYSWEELQPGLDTLSKIAPPHLQKKAQERSPLQEGLVRLLLDMHDFTRLTRYVDFTRSDFKLAESDYLKGIFGDKRSVAYSDVLAAGTTLYAHFRKLVPEGSAPEKLSGDARAINDLLGLALGVSQDRTILRMFPPVLSVKDQTAWYGLDGLASLAVLGSGCDPRHITMLQSLEAISATADAPEEPLEEALAPLKALREASASLAGARGEYEQIEQEVALYKLDPFHRSLYLFILAFIMIAFTWLLSMMDWKKTRIWGERGAWAVLSAALGLAIYGIVLRCIIRSRPPVTGLYDTVLFITTVAVLSCLVVELFNRRKIMLALAPILGAVGMFIAARYEVINRSDTMPRLQAVLNTNFWLTLHVLCIAIGYSAGLLAAAVAHVYVLGRFFQGRNASRSYGTAMSIGWTALVAVMTFWAGQYFGGLWLGVVSALLVVAILALHFRGNFLPTRPVDEAFYRTVGRMVYGLVGFALLFSLVGTILGGVWANESWGRFWGWDPKENGALLIVLAQLAMLHGRMAGWLKMLGFCIAAIMGGMVVAFSWWGVNLLGIGLHSYGFTSGIWSALMLFYGVELLVIGAGFHVLLRDRKPDPSLKSVRTIEVTAPPLAAD